MAEQGSESTWVLPSSTNMTSLGSQGLMRDSSRDSTIDLKDRFRQGFPNALRPLPQINFPLTAEDAEEMKWWNGARDNIINHLQARDITWDGVSLVNRRHPNAEASDCDLTILISAHRDLDSNAWRYFLQDSIDYLHWNNLSHVGVEIIDGRFARVPNHFIVEPSHPLVPAWLGIRKRIIKMLGGRQWFSLTAIRRGTQEVPEENPVTILITTSDSSSLQPLLEQIQTICANAGFPLKAEILEEKSLFGVDDTQAVLRPDDFTERLLMGSSVGVPSNPKSSATMGGYVILTKNNSRVRVGVTNFHLFWSKDTPRNIIDQGLPPQFEAFGIQAVVPSDQDTTYMLSEWNKILKVSANGPLVKVKERLKMLGEEQDSAIIQNLEDRGQLLSQEVNKMQSFNRNAGHLYACSGYRVHSQTKFGLDWALVRLPDNRVSSNLLPSRADVKNPLYLPPKSSKLEQFSSENLRGGELVIKRGRMTGLTAGTVNAIEPAVNLGGKTCSAWHIVGSVNDWFCRPGDSGSFVLDEHGRWCAQLFAAPFRTVSGDAYVLPVSDLITDIEQLTGGTVSLP